MSEWAQLLAMSSPGDARVAWTMGPAEAAVGFTDFFRLREKALCYQLDRRIASIYPRDMASQGKCSPSIRKIPTGEEAGIQRGRPGVGSEMDSQGRILFSPERRAGIENAPVKVVARTAGST
jgi:hypothetical protein